MNSTVTLPRATLEQVQGALDFAFDDHADGPIWEALCVVRAALEQPQTRMGCHMDLDPFMEPDECVLDTGKLCDCVYAVKYGDKAREYCGEWKIIQLS